MRDNKICVIGIDVGTSGCKVIAVGADGKVLASALKTYPLYTPQPGYSEQDPEDWWQGSCAAIKEVRAKLDGYEIRGVSLSGQMHGMVALDARHQVIRRAILWNDQRTVKQCETITAAAGGLSGLLTYTNNMMLTGYTGGKILWVKENEPENYARIKVVINPKDYIRFKLTGNLDTEVSDASGTGFFDTKKRVWQTQLMQKCGIDPAFFPKCYESTDITGTVSAAVAQLTGLPAGTPVAAGGGDAIISTTAMGLALPGRIGVTLGTSGVVAMGLPGYRDNPQGALQMFCGNAPDTWTAVGVTLAAAGSYEWFTDTFGDYEKEMANRNGGSRYAMLDALAEAVNPGSDGLIFQPYLMGERCPVHDADAKGSFIGITALHGKGHFARAVMEGVSYSLKQVYDLIAAVSGEELVASDIVVSGGGAKSRLWKQMLADLFDMPVYSVYGSAEGGAFGAALVAGAATGVWQNLQEAMQMATLQDKCEPIAANVPVYEKLYQKYVRLYDSLKWFYQQ